MSFLLSKLTSMVFVAECLRFQGWGQAFYWSRRSLWLWSFVYRVGKSSAGWSTLEYIWRGSSGGHRTAKWSLATALERTRPCKSHTLCAQWKFYGWTTSSSSKLRSAFSPLASKTLLQIACCKSRRSLKSRPKIRLMLKQKNRSTSAQWRWIRKFWSHSFP